MLMYLLMLMCSLAFSANATEHDPVNKTMQESVNQPRRCCNNSRTNSTKIDQATFNKDIEDQINHINLGLFALATTELGIIMMIAHIYYNLNISISNLRCKVKVLKRNLRNRIKAVKRLIHR